MPKRVNSTLGINGLRGHPELLHGFGHSLIRVESPSSMTAARLSSKVRVHSAISVAAQVNQEKGFIWVEPWTLSWYPTCTFLGGKFGGHVSSVCSDIQHILRTISKGATNERRTSRTEEL
jgi:hypothetical protein